MMKVDCVLDVNTGAITWKLQEQTSSPFLYVFLSKKRINHNQCSPQSDSSKNKQCRRPSVCRRRGQKQIYDLKQETGLNYREETTLSWLAAIVSRLDRRYFIRGSYTYPGKMIKILIKTTMESSFSLSHQYDYMVFYKGFSIVFHPMDGKTCWSECNIRGGEEVRRWGRNAQSRRCSAGWSRVQRDLNCDPTLQGIEFLEQKLHL